MQAMHRAPHHTRYTIPAITEPYRVKHPKLANI